MIKCNVLNEWCQPEQKKGDAALDLKSSKELIIYPGEAFKVPLGVSFKIPGTMCGILTHRSSLAFKEDSMASYGLIDSSFDSEVHAKIFNLGPRKLHILKGERICQIRFTRVYDYEIQYEEFVSTGKDGLGSSGRM